MAGASLHELYVVKPTSIIPEFLFVMADPAITYNKTAFQV